MSRHQQRLDGKRYGDWIKSGLVTPLTMTGLAKKLRLPVSSVSRMVSGERRIKVEELQLISDYIQRPLPVARVAKADGHDKYDELLEILGGVDWQRVDEKVRALPMSPRAKPKHKAVRIFDQTFGRGMLVIEPYDDKRRPEPGDIAVVCLRQGPREQLVVRRCVSVRGGFELRPLKGRMPALVLNPVDISVARDGTQVEYIGIAKYRVEELV